jgi:hypothetical protein
MTRREMWSIAIGFAFLCVAVVALHILLPSDVLRAHNADPSDFPAKGEAGCSLDSDCAYALRSIPLHPTTVGEAVDPQRAVDVACRDYHACIKQAEEARRRSE